MRNGKREDMEKSQIPFSIYDILAIIRKRWMLMLAIFVAVFAIGIYRTMHKTHLYRATAIIGFNTMLDGPRMGYPSQNRWRYRGLESTWFLKQLEIVQGQQVARRVAESLSLIKDPKNIQQVNNAVSLVRSSLQVTLNEDREIMSISGVSQDPDMTHKIANAAAESYISYSEERRHQGYKRSIKGITEQLADLEKKLDEAQRNLIDFIKKEKITSYGETNRGITPPMYLEGEIESRRFLENLNSQKVKAEIDLGKLREKYYDAHPKIIKILNDLKILNTKIEEEEKRLEGLKEKREKEIIRAKEKEIRYSILRRKVDVNKQIYDGLIRNLQETDINSETVESDVEILQYAKRPSMPFAPNKRKEAMLTFLIALLVSFGVGFVLQYTDSTFKSIEDIQAYYEYPVLSSIPFFKRKGRKQIILVDKEDDESNLKEAFRLLRTNLRFALSENPGKQMIITSTQKGEGKSTIAVNLGLTMAEAGANTLVVDADIRARSLKSFFGVKTDKGLTNYLSGKANFDEVLMPTHIENLTFAPSGPTVKNPSLLFESDYMKQFIKDADKKFDFIIFDAPPVGYVVDASLFGSLVDGVVMVVESEAVARKALSAAVDRLLTGKVNIYGFVFNKEAFSSRRYYYKYYRYYGESADKQI